MTIEVLIVGAGAIGSFYGSRLALNKDVHVSAVCRSNYKAVNENGFTVTSPKYGDYTWKPTRTFPSPEEARKSKVSWDYLVVTTKALPDVTDDSNLLEGLVSPSTSIVLIQNGLGVEQPYTARFPDATILSAVTIASAAQPSPGHIKHNRWTRINVGPYLHEPGTPSETNNLSIGRCHSFVSLLQTGGIKDAISDSHQKLQLVRWHKIAINAAMNPTSVLTGCKPNYTMSHDPLLSSHLRGIMNEILTTAPKIVGESFPKSFATADQIINSTRKNESMSLPSMAIDWQEGKPMEVEVILGNPVRIAKEKGFEMPRMESLYALIKGLQSSRDEEKNKKKGGDSKL